MEIFLVLLLKLLPLYFLMGLGFFVAKRLKADRSTVARILIYVVSPAVVFYGVSNVQLSLATLSLPVLFFCLCSLFCGVFYWVGKWVWGKESTSNLLAYGAGHANTGYFGLPVALILFDEKAFGLMVLCMLGFIMFESSLGFYVMARGNYTAKESLHRFLRLPSVYAFLVGILVAAYQVHLPEVLVNMFDQFKATYTVLGMMVIGMGLATVQRASLDLKFIGLSFFAKFLLWPALVLLLIVLDRQFLHVYEASHYPVFFLISIVPLSANAIMFATELDVHPEKASVAVMLSTVFALCYIPVMFFLFSGFLGFSS